MEMGSRITEHKGTKLLKIPSPSQREFLLNPRNTSSKVIIPIIRKFFLQTRGLARLKRNKSVSPKTVSRKERRGQAWALARHRLFVKTSWIILSDYVQSESALKRFDALKRPAHSGTTFYGISEGELKVHECTISKSFSFNVRKSCPQHINSIGASIDSGSLNKRNTCKPKKRKGKKK
ncbi:unnamed protein product, partial [Ixodes pacificus]